MPVFLRVNIEVTSGWVHHGEQTPPGEKLWLIIHKLSWSSSHALILLERNSSLWCNFLSSAVMSGEVAGKHFELQPSNWFCDTVTVVVIYLFVHTLLLNNHLLIDLSTGIEWGQINATVHISASIKVVHPLHWFEINQPLNSQSL